jgi:hypothetical protein
MQVIKSIYLRQKITKTFYTLELQTVQESLPLKTEPPSEASRNVGLNDKKMTKSIIHLPWTNFSLQDEPWAVFTTLEVAACIPCTYCPV